MKKVFFKSKTLLKVMVIFLVVGFVGVAFKVYATDTKPIMNDEVSVSKSNVYVNEEFDLTYTITPQPLALSDINTATSKEIVLVLDTSGSMNDEIGNKSKIGSLKAAANKFIEEFANVDNVKIGVISYSNNATIKKELISSKGTSNQTSLKAAYKDLSAVGATNIGDGIRIAYRMLTSNTSSTTAKKYVVMMSDGEPTSLTYSGYAGGYVLEQDWGYRYYHYDYYKYMENEKYFTLPEDLKEGDRTWRYYGVNDTNTLRYGTYGNQDPKGYCLKYSKLMATELKNKGIENYFIGFDMGDNNANLTDIAQSGGGTYYDAENETAMVELYTELAQKIKESHTVDEVKMNFKLPSGVQLASNDSSIVETQGKYVKTLSNIEYKLNSSKTEYVAAPFNISLKLKSNIPATHTFGGEDWTLYYKTLNKTVAGKRLSTTSVVVTKYDVSFALSRKLLPEGNGGKFDINKEFQIQYEIKPNSIKPQTVPKPKEIMLVVDTSGSMAWATDKDSKPSSGKKSRLQLTQEALNKFLDKFKNVNNLKIGLVTYESDGEIYKDNDKNYLFSTNDTNSMNALKAKINKLIADGGTNIGDGIRRAAWALSSNTDSQKYMILMTDGEPSAYSYSTNRNKYYTEINDNDVNYYPANTNDLTKGLEYAKLMASKLKEINGININTFSIGFAADNNGDKVKKLKDINNLTGGDFFDATKNNNTIDEVYSKIADEIKTDLSLGILNFTQTLPTGLISTDTESNLVAKEFKINYNYNSSSNEYEAEPITFTVNVKGTEIKDHKLIDDAKISYTDLGGTPSVKAFDQLSISILGDIKIKQGLFQMNGNNASNSILEKTIKYLKDSEAELAIAPNIEYKIGTFIKTSGQQTDINIKLNFQGLDNAFKVNVTSVNIYSVKADGTLEKLSIITPNIVNNNTFSPNINLTFGQVPSGEYRHYIVNYNYKIDRVEEIPENSNIIIVNRSTNEVTKDFNELRTKLVNMPDVF